ncbi:MAG: cysteine--tRNA ligase [Nitrososphaeria archaeon]
MAIWLYNTLVRRKQTFRPIKDKEVKMYCCGLTVYDYPHIGNMKTYVNEDNIRRVLEVNGYKVTHVMNITDVGHLTSQADTGEDKVEMTAREMRKDARELAEYYANIFFKDLETLNILKPHIIAKATDNIKEMIELVKKLEDKGYTYVIEGDGVYFDTSKFKGYGRLTGMNFKQLNKYLRAGARVEVVPGKRNITDFALWKFSPKDVKRQMEWPSPWGVGFPGWHIECSAMSMKYLGETFDIHCGGIDHIYIHHCNEIAQSEAATGKRFVNYWLHCQFLLVEGKKMSKSLKNYYTLKDLLDRGYSWREIRYLLMSSHYRHQLNFTFRGLDAARASINRITEFLKKLNSVQEGKHSKILRPSMNKAKTDFLKAINDDINLPEALAVFFNFISKINKMLTKNRITKEDSKNIIELTLWFDKVLGLRLDEFLGGEGELPEEAKSLIEARRKARQEKNFELADRLREELRNRFGIFIEDTKEGERWRRL